MRSKATLVSGLLGAAILGSLAGRPQVASSADPCARATQLPPGSSIGSAIQANAFRGAAAYGMDPQPAAVDERNAMIRHVATSGRRLAFVRDELGDDVVEIVTPNGLRSFPQEGEAVNPAWSPKGDLVWAVGSRVAVLASGSGTVRLVPGPRGGGSLFAPVFATDRTVVVVRSAPPTRAVPEDEWSNDLWMLRLGSGAWRRLTTFPAGPDRWTAIRTPVGIGHGVVDFVRIEGTASQTGTPRFELWRLSGHAVSRLRLLPGERYLAGMVGVDYVWNIPHFPTATWRLVRERPDGTTTPLGCGAVAVDPMDTTDPDRGAPHEEHTTEAPDPAGDAGGSVPAAILVGDFPAEARATEAAREVASAYGSELVEVIRHADAPTLLMPGAWAVLLHLEDGADPAGALETFRRRLPSLASMSWMVTP
jgi:hypothetical protein